MKESSLHLFLFNCITLQNKTKQNPSKQTPLLNKETSDLKVWLYSVRCAGEKKFYVHSREVMQGGKNRLWQPEQKATQLSMGSIWSVTGAQGKRQISHLAV